MRAPFTIFSWKNPCIETLLSYLWEDANHTLSALANYTIIVPHDRIKHHITNECLRDIRYTPPFLLPYIYTMQEYTAHLATKTIYADGILRTQLSLHEELFILQKYVVPSLKKTKTVVSSIANLEAKTQSMWLQTCISIINECFIHNIVPQQYTAGEGSILEEATAEALHALFISYQKVLEEHSYTTPAYTAYCLAQHIQNKEMEKNYTAIQNNTVILLGFATIAGSENAVMHGLWEYTDTRVILYTDPTCMKSTHSSTQLHREWIQQWGVTTEVFGKEHNSEPTSIHIYEAPTIHSEIEYAVSIVEHSATESIAIVPLESKLLSPLLHTMETENANISIGYPFEYSSLALLIEYCIVLQEKRHKGAYPLRELVALLEHPYARMAHFEVESLYDIQTLFIAYCQKHSGVYVDIRELYNRFQTQYVYPQELYIGMEKVLETCVFFLERVSTYTDLAEFCANIIALFEAIPEPQRSVIDAECSARLYHNGIRQLQSSICCNEALEPVMLFQALRMYMQTERVPFIASKNNGVHVIGIAEIQSIPFKHILLLEAIEGVFPRIPEETPLLSERVRMHVLGISQYDIAVLQESYYLYSILNSTPCVDIIYSTGSGKGGVGGGAVRSRFIEEYIWEEQKNTYVDGALPEECVQAIPLPPLCVVPLSEGVEKTDALHVAIEKRLQKGISATFLEAYCRCPFAWVQQYIYNIMPIEREDILPAYLVGKCIHSGLEAFWKPYIGKELTRELLEDKAEVLYGLLNTELEHVFEERVVPLDMRIMLSNILKYQCGILLQAQPEKYRIKALEEKVTGSFAGIPVQGTLDRIEDRNSTIVVLDYKTGKSRRSTTYKKIFSMVLDANVRPIAEYMEHIHKAPIQLFVYIWLLHQKYNTVAINAGYHYISAREKVDVESMLFQEDIEKEEYIEYCIPRVFEIILEDMRTNPRINCTRGKHCEYCGYATLCM